MNDTVNLFDDTAPSSSTETIQSWVTVKRDRWRDYFDSNYKPKFDEYYRLWRGEWAASDKTRESERSKLIAPALMQAVEENAAEVEEATFGRGPWFDIDDDFGDANPEDIMILRNKLHDDFAFTKTKSAVSECILNAAVYGTGCAEIMLEEVLDQKVATQPALGGDLVSVGVNVTPRTIVKLRPVLPQNFLVDPNATTVDNGLGVIIDEFVGKEFVKRLQEQGVYRDKDIGTATTDSDLEPTQELVVYEDDRVRLTKYFGLVPRHLLDATAKKEEDEIVDLGIEQDDDSFYVEAIVVLGNGHLLKAEANPYMMQDRPVIAFPWDVVPGRFLGRGVCEKGYNSQKALDAEIRARVDALALTIHPMLAIDATRMPRGSKPSVRPGKMLKVNGNPSEILQPFNFGQVSQITFAQAGELQKMVQQATGAINASGMPTAVAGGDVAAGALSMSLGAVLKRHKRTLMSFQDNFLMPLIQKTAWRYMQFDPENYPVGDYKFTAYGTLGAIAREFEVTQMTQLLQTVSSESPLYPTLLASIVDNMNLSNREKLLKELEEAQKPNPEQQKAAEEARQKELALKDASIGLLEGQAAESNARATKYQAEAIAVPQKINLEQVQAATNNLGDGTGDDVEFDRRLRILSELREDRKIQVSERAQDLAERNAPAQPAPPALPAQGLPPIG